MRWRTSSHNDITTRDLNILNFLFNFITTVYTNDQLNQKATTNLNRTNSRRRSRKNIEIFVVHFHDSDNYSSDFGVGKISLVIKKINVTNTYLYTVIGMNLRRIFYI